MNKKVVHGSVLIALIAIATIAVGVMVKSFLMVIFLSGLTAAMATPLNRKFLKLTKGKEGLSSSATLITLFLCVLVPLSGILGMFIKEAITISDKIQPKIETFVSDKSAIEEFVTKLPKGELIIEYQDEIIKKGGEIASSVSMYFVNKLTAITKYTVQFLFLIFLYLYSLFFFIKDGRGMLNKILYYLPLPPEEESRLLERFTSVTKATLKGTLLIGAIQGILAGIALGLAGVESAFFWSIIMMVLSVIPVVGTVLVWLPAAIMLIIGGSVVPGILVLLWCGIVVGNIDNLLRPKLVGQDAGLHELLILFSTLGGLSLFGMAGFVVGPILAAIWVTLWDIYGEMFENYLPAVEPQTIPIPAVPEEVEVIADTDADATSDDIAESKNE